MMKLLAPQRFLQGHSGNQALVLDGIPTASQNHNGLAGSGFVAFPEVTSGVGSFVEKSVIGYCADVMAISIANSVVSFLYSTLADDILAGKLAPFVGAFDMGHLRCLRIGKRGLSCTQ